MSTGCEARVALDVDGTGAALAQQLNPLVGLVGRLTDCKDLLDQWPGNLKSIFDSFSVRKTASVDASDWDVAFKLER